MVRTDFFKGTTYEDRLTDAFMKFFGWCQLHGYRPACGKFEAKLTMNKAFDVKLCVGWLADEILSVHGEKSDVLQTTTFCLAKPGSYTATC